MGNPTFMTRWALFLGLLLGALIVTHRVVDRHDQRADLTEAKLHTISPATARILAKIEDKVSITYWASERAPAGAQNLRRDTIDYLEEYARTSGGRVEITVIDPYAVIEKHVEEQKAAREKEETEKANSNGDGADRDEPADDVAPEKKEGEVDVAATERERQEIQWAEDKKQELAQEGVPELRGRSIQDGGFGYVQFYSTIVIRYLDRDPEIIQIHQSLDGFEYELASRIVRMTATEKPKVAFFLGKPDDVIQLPPDPQLPPDFPPQTMHVYQPLLEQVLGAQYEIVEVALTEDSTIPGDAQLLIVAEPHLITPRQLYEIDRSIAQGRPAIILAASTTGGLDEKNLRLERLEPRLNPLFEKWGFSLGREVLSSLDCGAIEVVRQRGPFRVPEPAPFPLCPRSRGRGLNQESPLTQGLAALIFPFASEIRPNPLVLEGNGITLTPLATTDDEAWNNNFKPALDRGMLEIPGDPQRRKQFVLAALLEGTFPFTHKVGDPIPRWQPLPEGETAPTVEDIETIPEIASAPGRVVVIGSADIGKYAALATFQRSSNNLAFIAGVVETLALGQDLVQIRAKTPIPRPLENTTSSDRWWASYVNIVGVPLAILILALARFLFRRAVTRAFETRLARAEG